MIVAGENPLKFAKSYDEQFGKKYDGSVTRYTLERERTISRRRPLYQSWQNFIYQLRLKKPKLGTCLNHWLRDGFFEEQGGTQ